MAREMEKAKGEFCFATTRIQEAFVRLESVVGEFDKKLKALADETRQAAGIE